MADVPLVVVSDNSSSERRVTPSWSISRLKTKLEPITGIPPSAQRLSLKTVTNENIPIEGYDEEAVYLSSFPLAEYAELHVRNAVLSWAHHNVLRLDRVWNRVIKTISDGLSWCTYSVFMQLTLAQEPR